MSTALPEKQAQCNPALAPLVACLVSVREALSRQIDPLPEDSELRADLECICHDALDIAINSLSRLAGCSLDRPS